MPEGTPYDSADQMVDQRPVEDGLVREDAVARLIQESIAKVSFPSLNRRRLVTSVLLKEDNEDQLELGRGIVGEYVTFERNGKKGVFSYPVYQVFMRNGSAWAEVKWEEDGEPIKKFFPVDEALRKNIAENKMRRQAEMPENSPLEPEAEDLRVNAQAENLKKSAKELEKMIKELSDKKERILSKLDHLVGTPEEEAEVRKAIEDYFNFAEISVGAIDNKKGALFLEDYNIKAKNAVSVLSKLAGEWAEIDRKRAVKVHEKIKILAEAIQDIETFYLRSSENVQ